MSVYETLTPVEIDTELANLWEERQRYSDWLRAAQNRFDYEVERYKRLHPSENYEDTYNGRAALQTLMEYRAKLTEIRKAEQPYLDEFDGRGGWLRYFLVKNTNGHVHRGMDCTTCFPTTTYGWLVDLADCDEKQMVAEYGEVACTVCFPDAPTYKGYGDGTSSFARAVAGARDERAAAKAERDAKKAAKLLPEPQRVDDFYGRTELIETVYAAKQWIKSAIDRRAWGYFNDNPRDCDAILDQGIDQLRSQLRQRGVDTDALIVKWTKAAEKEMGR